MPLAPAHPTQLLPSSPQLKAWALQAVTHAPYGLFLDSCADERRAGSYAWLAAWAHDDAATLTTLPALQAEWPQAPWLLGALPYSLKATLHPECPNSHAATIPWPEVAFFKPAVVLAQPWGNGPLEVYGSWQPGPPEGATAPTQPPSIGPFTSNFTQEAYLQAIRALQQHIAQGDTYEVNFAQEFTASAHLPQPERLFQAMLAAQPVPFGALLHWQHRWLLAASPERLLAARPSDEGTRLITQPIKGTVRRNLHNPQHDAQLAHQLHHSPKERAENVMIVDMSRNDLARVCQPGSVHMPHLFEVQAFRTLHHMVSTIEGTLEPPHNTLAALQALFPPPSMTGAPKIRTMQLIERYEQRGRGLYAGAVGYKAPDGSMDFNIVIRALVYSQLQQVLSYHVGGAITYDSAPQAEYDESLLKAQAIRQALAQLQPSPVE